MDKPIPEGTHMWRVEQALRERFPEAELKVQTSQPYVAGSIYFKLLEKSLILECGIKGDFLIIHYTSTLGDLDAELKTLDEVLTKLTQAYGVHQQPPPQEKMQFILEFVRNRYPSCIVSIDSTDSRRGGFVDILYGEERVVIECYKNGGYVVSDVDTFTYGDHGGILRTEFRDAVRDVDNLILEKGNKGEFPIRYQRIETSVTRFGDDWPGVFIRGDDCHYFLLQLQMVTTILHEAERTKGLSDVLAMKAVEGLIDLFRSSNIEAKAECQKLKSADDCFIIPVPGDQDL